MPSALDKIRVVDFSRDFTGVIISLVLSDFGAEVVKVEPPEGDQTRSEPAFYMWHRGKKSVVVDFDDPAGREQARELAAGADVVVMTRPPNQARELGLDYETVAKKSPGLVYASVSALGDLERYAHLPLVDGLVYAKSGSLTDLGALVNRTGPGLGSLPYPSYAAAQTALQGIFAALYVRERCGRGQHVRASLIQGFCCQDPWSWIISYLAKKYPEAYMVTPAVPQSGSPIFEGIFKLLIAQTKDGYWLQFAQYSPHLFTAFLTALDLDRVVAADAEFADAPRFETYEVSLRFWNVMLERVRGRTLAEWQEHFKAHPDVGAEVFRTPEEALDHPQLLHNGSVLDFEDPRAGKTRQLGPVIQLFDTPAEVSRPAPELGQDTEEVLGRLAAGQWRPVRPKGKGGVPKRPLEGVTIIELSMYYAAPYGPTLLADLGARVIKIEPPRGDDIRRAMPIPETGAVKVTQGKESVAADLGTAEGRKIVHELVKTADMVMMSYRGEVGKRLEIDYETLRRINPRIVYLNAPGYGIDGPYATQPAYAPTMTAAVGGALFQAGATVPGRDEPITSPEQLRDVSNRLRRAGMGGGNADGVSAVTVASGMLLGLLTRERSEAAQEMLTAMISSTAYMVSAEMIQYQGKQPARRVDGDLYGYEALERLYETKDGWVFLGATYEEGWKALVEAAGELGGGKVELAGDPRFADRDARRRHDGELADILGAFFKMRGAEEWERLCRQRKVPCVKVEERDAFLFSVEDPIMVENGFVDEVDHALFGPHPRMGPLVHFSLTPGVSRPGVLTGQHTDKVLGELGYTPEAIADLEKRKVIVRG